MYHQANITAKNHHSMDSIHEFLGQVLEIPGGYGNDLDALEAALLARREPLHFYVRSREGLRRRFGRRTCQAMLQVFERVAAQNPSFPYTLYEKESDFI